MLFFGDAVPPFQPKVLPGGIGKAVTDFCSDFRDVRKAVTDFRSDLRDVGKAVTDFCSDLRDVRNAEVAPRRENLRSVARHGPCRLLPKPGEPM